jgi:hypothetical protein
MSALGRRHRRPVEHCELCLLEAPSWEEADYLEWHVEFDEGGGLRGVLCAGCLGALYRAFPGAAVEAASQGSRGKRSAR